MPYSYNHSPHHHTWLFCRPLRGLRYPFYTHPGLTPRALAAAPGRGLFSSAHGSAVRRINTCERKREELLSPQGARIIAVGVAAQRRNLRNAKKSFGTPLKTAVTACLGVGLAEDGPASA